MIAKLEFELPEEKEEFNLASNASSLYTTIWDIDHLCRDIIKHTYFKSTDVHENTMLLELAEEVRDIIWDSRVLDQ